MSPTQLTTFPSFPRLPTEIRIMIWKFAIQATPGRHIVLRYTPPITLSTGWPLPLNEQPVPLSWLTVPLSQQRPEITSGTQIPAVLHACHLSRHLSKERWTLSLGTYEGAPTKVYVDVRTDALYFPDGTILAIWYMMGDWAEVFKFLDGWVFVTRNADVQNAIRNTVHACLSYTAPDLTLSVILEHGYSILRRRETD